MMAVEIQAFDEEWRTSGRCVGETMYTIHVWFGMWTCRCRLP